LALFSNRPFRLTSVLVILVLLVCAGFLGAYALTYSQTATLEVKEPLEITAYTPLLSLYPGESLQFSVTVENHASVNYNAKLVFYLNDTSYQSQYVEFSDETYDVAPGTNVLNASVSILGSAPAECLSLSIDITRNLSNPSSPQAVPSGIQNYVPIHLTNRQNVSTAIPFQQMITINSSAFQDYEATNLQNIEFFDANGQIIASWLESGNSNNANETVYWLKVTNGIPANSSVTVYMGFALKDTSLFSNQITGEAPALSTNYGENDNGANIFLFYDNFNGTSLSSQWLIMHSEGSLDVNDGLTVAGSGHDWQSTGSVNAFNPQTCVFDAYAYFTTLSGSVVAEHPGPTVSIGWDVPYGPSQEDSPQYYIGDLADSYALYNCASGVATGTAITGGSTSNYNIWSVWEETNQSCMALSYGLEKTTSNQNFNASVSSHFGLSSLGSSAVNVQWVRIRSLPYNEAMPTVMLGDVVTVNY
jgi:hypothetical protein